jgi:hypothetical protein
MVWVVARGEGTEGAGDLHPSRKGPCAWDTLSCPDHEESFQQAVWSAGTCVFSTMRSVRYRLRSSTERLRGLPRSVPIPCRHGRTFCHLFASLLEEGYSLLHVPHVGFERVQCCDHQCLNDCCIVCFACHGGSLCKTFLSRGGNPVRLRDGSVIRCGYLP